MNVNSKFPMDYLNYEGQIISLLISGPKRAHHIYQNLSASQPTVSSLLSRMVDREIITCQRDRQDRRGVIYSLDENFLNSLNVGDFAIDTESSSK